MRALKIAAGFVVLLLLIGGTAGHLLATFGAAHLQEKIVAAVEKRTGRTLKIEGGLSFALWPDVTVKLGRATLSEAGGAGEFARLEEARVAVALAPLLSKQVQVREVAIDGLAATLVRRKDGTLNIADLIGAPAGKTVPVPRLEIAAIRVANARVDWRDERSGGAFSLTDIELSGDALRFADSVGRIDALRLAAATCGANGRLSANLTLSGIAGDAAALEIAAFALAADAQLADTHLLAKLASPVALDFGRQSLAFSRLSGQLALAHPRLPAKSLALPLFGVASADFAEPSASLRLEAWLDESTIRAKFDVDSFAPLALVFDLDIDQLDLDRYLPRKRQEDAKRIDLTALESLSLFGTVHIGRLKAAGIEARDVRLHLGAKVPRPLRERASFDRVAMRPLENEGGAPPGVRGAA